MTTEYRSISKQAAKFTIDYHGELDSQQFAAVDAPPGPTLVIARAGSGKTRTITYRVARSIELGISPDRILLMTFTNKAARVMLQRIEQLLKIDSKRICGGTFHSIGNRILRRHCKLLGYQSNYSILDPEDVKDLLSLIVDGFNVTVTDKRFPQPGLLREIISFSLNTGNTIPDIITQKYAHFYNHVDAICSIAEAYLKRKIKSNVMDYDDLLVNWRRLLEEFPDSKNYWTTKFEQILVDEFQDTNLLQAKIIDEMASHYRNLMVVGDDFQSIFQWRGTCFNNMYEFATRYPDARVFPLESNYRSTPEIVVLANCSIKNNKRQLPKNLIAHRKSQCQLPALIALADEEQQAQFVAKQILKLRDEGLPLAEMAVLYRSHWNSLQLELELTKRNIPYEIRSGLKFFEQAHIKDIIAYLRILSNPKDELSFKRVVKMVPGIGKAKANSLWEKIHLFGDPAKLLALAASTERGAISKLLKNLADLFQKLFADMANSSPSLMIEQILSSDYKDYLTNKYENAQSRLEDIEQLANYATKFESTDNFLADLALTAVETAKGKGGITAVDPARAYADESPLVLTSIHSSKGLEWKAVFLIWAAETCFPNQRSLNTEAELEEERRLFYVAVTRAKDQLYLCYPLMSHRKYAVDMLLRPSRFITELPEQLFDKWNVLEPASSQQSTSHHHS